ncbi:MAG: glycosyltransferase [Alphaproteobacteria bacterium]|nr:glycosyltransferase [Alphaproteobacteria bacterium]
MRILHIMAGRGLGGAETYATDVMVSLHKAGVDQCIVMSRKAPRYEELKRGGLRLAPWVLDIPLRPLQKFLMHRLVAREKPDVTHCWMRRAASLTPRSKKPVIGWFGGYYNPRHFRCCSHFVGVTKDIVAHMVKNNVPFANAYFIPTFPDIVTMPPADRMALATPKDAKVLLALSRLHPKKGLDTLLQALVELPAAYAWLAGEGPIRKELEKLAKDLGVIDRVRFLGWRTDRAALLRAADICVLPSRYEPFGTVILEAWAAGTPFVACRSAGPAAHVEDGENGLLTPIDDAPALAGAMRKILGDDDLRRRLVAQGYAAYIKSYTPEAVTQQWIQLYRNLAGR